MSKYQVAHRVKTFAKENPDVIVAFTALGVGLGLGVAGESLASVARGVTPHVVSKFVPDSAPQQLQMGANYAASIAADKAANATTWLQTNMYSIVPAAKGFGTHTFVEFLQFVQVSASKVLPINFDTFNIMQPGNSTLLQLPGGHTVNVTLLSADWASKTALMQEQIGHMVNDTANAGAVETAKSALNLANKLVIGSAVAFVASAAGFAVRFGRWINKESKESESDETYSPTS